MITLEDCLGLCGLTEEEVLAIAEHEHLPEIAATALAAYLSSQRHGREKVLDMIVDDIRQAQIRSDKEHVVTLLHVLHHFLKTHPEARPSDHPWSRRFLPTRLRSRSMPTNSMLDISGTLIAFRGASRSDCRLRWSSNEPGADDVHESIHMHLNFGLFADVLRELAATVGRIPKDDVMHRDQLAKAVAELHTALAKV